MVASCHTAKQMKALLSSKILMIGCGNMGSAMLKGWIAAGVKPEHVQVMTSNPASSKHIAEQFLVHASHDPNHVALTEVDIVVIAIKPQQKEAVLPAYQELIAGMASAPVVISVMAGVSVAAIQPYFPASTIIRLMPNLAAAVAASMTGLYQAGKLSDEQKERIEALARANGAFLWVHEEAHMDVITALCGSGPAFLFYLMDAMVKQAEQLGLSYEQALAACIETFKGAALVARQSCLEEHDSLEGLRKKVTSKAGTTEAGLSVWMHPEHQVADIIAKTLEAATNRAKELSS